MYIERGEFERNIGKYMILAKKVDLYIVDSTEPTVWTLRCRRNLLQAQLAKTIRDAFGSGLRPVPA